jgi:hypothetical protein
MVALRLSDRLIITLIPTLICAGLPDNWANRAYIGMTATTGALADNHDVISLKTYSDLAVLEAEEEEERVSISLLFCTILAHKDGEVAQ